MAQITLNDVTVDFPIFSSRSRGLINTVFRYAKQEQRRVEASGLGGYQVHALRGINLDLCDGDRVGLIGRNGAGKTTLLRVLSGVYEPTGGSVDIRGRVSALTDIMLGMDIEATGYDNIILRAIVLGMSRRQATALIPEIEAFTELGDYLHLPVRAYSQGMLLRLAFAVSTAIAPDILLMDEMIGAGDAQFLEKAHARLARLMDNVSILVIASHNEKILTSFCNKGVLLREGRVVHAGPVDECMAWHYRGATPVVVRRCAASDGRA